MAPVSPTFCALPWVHRFVSERGRLFPCAFSMESGQALRDENGRFFSAESASLAWNAEGMRHLRRDLLGGTVPESCARCFRLESYGLPSLREVANRGWDLPALAASTAPDGSAPETIRSLDLRLGNFCNLRCRMCSPESSAKLADEFRALYPGLSESYFEELEHLDWFRSPEGRAKLLASASELRELHFAGGEPLLIPELKLFLQELVDSGAAGGITLTFNTNLTAIPAPVREYWRHFRQVKLIVSLDGVGAVNDYIRFPSDFRKLDANLRFLDDHYRDFGNLFVCIHTTVQLYNILSIDRLIDYVTGSFRNFFPFPILSALHWPAYFAPAVLPAALKRVARERLLAVVDRQGALWKTLEHRCDYENGAARFERSIRGLLRILDEDDGSTLFPEFQRATAILDASRGQSLGAVVPELLGFLRQDFHPDHRGVPLAVQDRARLAEEP